jgi:hypothetical protein
VFQTVELVSASSLLISFLKEEIVRSTAWRYVSDALTREEALSILRAKEKGKAEREHIVRDVGLVHSLAQSIDVSLPSLC